MQGVTDTPQITNSGCVNGYLWCAVRCPCGRSSKRDCPRGVYRCDCGQKIGYNLYENQALYLDNKEEG